MADVVVIGAGVNGLVAANLLVDAGLSVTVAEANESVGGACRSGQPAAPGFTTDLFSAFYPLGSASRILRALRLEDHGLTWSHAPAVLAHPLPDTHAGILSRDLDTTANNLDSHRVGDGDAWRNVVAGWHRLREPLIDAVMTPFPPARQAFGLLRRTGAADALRLARFLMLPVRRYAEEEFAGPIPGLLIAGNALHTDLAPDSAGSAVFGWLLAMLGQDVGFPVVQGGAGLLSEALAQRARARGATGLTGKRVSAIVVRQQTAQAVRLDDGTVIDASRGVVADIDAPQLYTQLVASEHLPPRLFDDLRRFQWDNSTFKVDWALSGPIPWGDPTVAAAGTVHLGGTMNDLSWYSGELHRGLVPADPFVVLGQMTTSDPTRSPAGTESAWAYLHVPQHPVGDAGGDGISGDWTERDVTSMVARLEAVVERSAPGFGSRIIGRHVQSPVQLQQNDAALGRGALNGGTANLHQQLIFRPVPGLGRAETPLRGLFLASMSAHPGGGVHGAGGSNAARAPLSSTGLLGPVRTAGWQALQRATYRG